MLAAVTVLMAGCGLTSAPYTVQSSATEVVVGVATTPHVHWSDIWNNDQRRIESKAEQLCAANGGTPSEMLEAQSEVDRKAFVWVFRFACEADPPDARVSRR